MCAAPNYASDKIHSAAAHWFRNSATRRLISWRLRRFRTLTSPIFVMPTVHQKHAPSARWVALTDTVDLSCFGRATVYVDKLLTELPTKIQTTAERGYLEEALICF